MVTELGVYFEPELAVESANVAGGIRGLFPRIKITLLGERKVPESVWDTFLAQYDAPSILALMIEPKEYMGLLWLIKGELGDTHHKGLFGATLGRRGVVSVSRMPNADALVKESAHEVGHVLGLGHCLGACLMRPSRTIEEVHNKTGTFCQSCREQLNRAMENLGPDGSPWV